jgi:hypothetical protein
MLFLHKLQIRSSTLVWTDSLNDDKRVNPNSKNILRTYRKFKSIFKLEPYLLFGTKQRRKLLTKFRISAHNLNIEKGYQTDVKQKLLNLKGAISK